MFAEEEEWPDYIPDNEQSCCVVKVQSESPVGKQKAVSKHCLKRTLQTIGSAPAWEYIKPSVCSDEDTEDPLVHAVKKKKKKRCKKQKKISDTTIEVDQVSERAILQKSAKDKVDKASSERSSEKLHKAVEVSPDKRLSRQQWKNKVKNKRKCKNKFRLESRVVVDVKLEEEVEVRQAQNLSMKSVEKSNKVCLSTDTTEKTQTITKKVYKDTKSPAKPKYNVLKTSTHNQCVERKPVTVDEKLRDKKPQSSLIIHNAEHDEIPDNTNLTQEKQKEVVKYEVDRSAALRSRMEKRLESARFRYINEMLYTSTSGEAKRIFKQDPDAVRIYHSGYTEQVKHWPANPVDSIISYIQQRSSSLVIADFGCGDCKIARSVKNKVHCFDLAPVSDLVTVCDMASVPLPDSTVDIAVFCLSLMGTNLADFLTEASRVLTMGGVLKIAEVASRFDNLRQFTGALSHLGFVLVSKDTNNSHFYSFEFRKEHSSPNAVRKIGFELKPCLYKKR